MPARVFRYLVPGGVVFANIRVMDDRIDASITLDRSCSMVETFQLTADHARALCPPAGSAMLSFGWHEQRRLGQARWIDLAASASAHEATIPQHIQRDLKDTFPLRVLIPGPAITSMHDCWVMVFADPSGNQITTNVEVEDVCGSLMSAHLLDTLSRTRRRID